MSFREGEQKERENVVIGESVEQQRRWCCDEVEAGKEEILLRRRERGFSMKERIVYVEGRTTLFQPETLLPTQFFVALRQKESAQGERRLMVAILEDAVECFQKYLWATDSRSCQLQADAEQWLLSDDTSWLFSFVNICDTLGIHPLFLRRGLTQWQAQQLAPDGSRVNRPRIKLTLRSESKRSVSPARLLRAVSKT